MSEVQQEIAGISLHDRLLDAAEQVVARDGVGNLTLEAVARQAGVSKGGLLYHFPSKESLVIAIVDRLAKRCEAKQAQALAEQPQGPGSFTRAYAMARAKPHDPQEEPIHTALLAAAGTDPHYLDPIRKRFADWQKRLETDGIEPAVACIVRLAIDGMCLCRLLGLPVPEGELRQKVLDALLAMTECDQGSNTPSGGSVDTQVESKPEGATCG